MLRWVNNPKKGIEMSLLNKKITEKEYESVVVENGFEKMSSMNKHTLINDKTRLLIVGTITPPDGTGFFYTSKHNKLYGYIDDSLNTNLKKKKKELRECNSDDDRADIVEQIKKELNQVGISFIDVAKYVIRKEGSSKDTDIKHIVLDYEAFKNISKIKHVICNSRDAKECFDAITNNRYESEYLPQRCGRGAIGRREEWIRKLREYTR